MNATPCDILRQFDLSGCRALVTGGGRGIGRAIALGLAGAGAEVAVVSRNRANCESVATEIRSLGGVAHAFEADMSRWEQVDELARAAFGAMGGIDILVNNAGQTDAIVPLCQVSPEYFDAVYHLNVRAPLQLSARMVELVDGRNSLSVINVSSTGARVPFPSAGVYSSSKAALEQLTKIMALEWVGRQVRVNAVAPGPMDTNMTRHSPPEATAAIRNSVPMGRIADPRELVGAVVYLASTASSFVTASVLTVAGGI